MKIIYSDLNRMMTKNTQTTDFDVKNNEDAVRSSIFNILTTKKQERRMMPEFGASLETMLFEPMDNYTAKKIGNVILEEVSYWEPRVIIKNIYVVSNTDDMQYDITLEYIIKLYSNGNVSNINFVLRQD